MLSSNLQVGSPKEHVGVKSVNKLGFLPLSVLFSHFVLLLSLGSRQKRDDDDDDGFVVGMLSETEGPDPKVGPGSIGVPGPSFKLGPGKGGTLLAPSTATSDPSGLTHPCHPSHSLPLIPTM